MSEFEKELEGLINRTCQENGSDTPDFLLAEYLTGCLEVYGKTVKKRDNWHGFKPFGKYETMLEAPPERLPSSIKINSNLELLKRHFDVV
jgi:hypothetical protein